MATDAIAIIKANFAPNAARIVLQTGSPQGRAQIEAEFSDPRALIGQYSGDPSLPGYAQDNCSKAGGYTPTGTAITSKATGALGAATTGYGIASKLIAALAPIPVIGQVIAGIAAIALPFIGKLFQHHAQAVAREQGTLCALVPQVNQTLIETDQAVANGTLDVADADAQLEAMVQNFDQAVAGITQDSGNICNAGCVMKSTVRAVANLHEQKYHNSPLYYLKHYWWIGALAFIVFLLGRKD